MMITNYVLFILLTLVETEPDIPSSSTLIIADKHSYSKDSEGIIKYCIAGNGNYYYASGIHRIVFKVDGM